MAWQLVVEVLDHAPRNLTALERYLLVVLAEYTKDTETRQCERSTQDLAWRMGLSASRVGHILADLSRKDLDVRVPLQKDGRDLLDKHGRPVYAVRGQVPRYRLPTFLPPNGCPCLACHESHEGGSIRRPSERSPDPATIEERSLGSAEKVATSGAEGRYVQPERSPDLATPNVPGTPVPRSPRARGSDAARLAEEVGATEEEINALAAKLRSERPDIERPIAWLRKCHNDRGHLAKMLDELRSTERRASISAELDAARADPGLECEHGTPGGRHIRSDTGTALCAVCRHPRRRLEVVSNAS